METLKSKSGHQGGSEMDRFEGKVAIVTGGSGGIGRATALAFAREGARVAIADVFVDGGEETARLIREKGGEVTFLKTDVSNPREAETLINRVVETYGRLDFAHNNAGIDGAQAPTAEYPVEMWNRVIAINLMGVWLCMKYEIPQMLKVGKGAIVNTASVGGLMALTKISAYIAAKFGVIGITKTAALEYAVQNIRVNAICPGWTDTPMTVREAQQAGIRLEEFKQMAANFVPVKRMGTPDEMAEAVIWLCSDAASYVTGHALIVDGALTAGWPLG